MAKEKYPDTMKFKYAATNALPEASQTVIYLKKQINRVKYKLLRLSGRNVIGRSSMNPFDYWYKTNEAFWKFIDSYWKDNRRYTEGHQELLSYMTQLIERGNTMEKLLALSALSAIKQFTGE